MDLWIKTAPNITWGGSLVKVDNVIIKQKIYDSPKTIWWYIITFITGFNEEDSICLGKYTTKERALEVLGEIQEALENRICFENYNSMNIVFKMPKE